MRILFITNALGMGGIETNLVRLAGAFTEKGHEVTVAARSGILTSDVVRAGARHRAMEVRLRAPFAVIRDVRALQHLIHETRPDVVHIFSASAALLWWLGDPWGLRRRLHGGPTVVSSIMGLESRPGESRWRVQARNWLTCWGADRVLVISPAIAHHLARLPVRRSKLLRMPVVGVELPPERRVSDARSRVRDVLNVPRSHALVCTIGALAPRKSHELFLRAAAEVVRKRDAVHFLVAGEGPERPRLEAEIASLGIGQRARLLGHWPDIGELLDACDVCVRPGVVEGFIGITVLEAQARGVPVVAFETEDVKLAITNGETGFLVRNGDPRALAESVLRLIEDPELGANLAKRGREHVAALWSIEAVAGGLLRCYETEAGVRA